MQVGTMQGTNWGRKIEKGLGFVSGLDTAEAEPKESLAEKVWAGGHSG